jgi:hypothetical protein
MKFWIAMVVGCVVLAPMSAKALNPGECSRLLRQIYHFKMLEMRAEELDSDVYADRMGMQQDVLRERFDQRCEGFTEDDRLMQQAMADFARALKLGAEAAAKFFSMGAY